jgi:hypothetical protein
VVYELLLSFQPLAPAYTADLIEGTPAQLVLEGLKCHLIPVLPTTAAMDNRHEGKIDIIGNVIQSIGGSPANE